MPAMSPGNAAGVRRVQELKAVTGHDGGEWEVQLGEAGHDGGRRLVQLGSGGMMVANGQFSWAG